MSGKSLNSRTMKPILLLDVDGVLNVPPQKRKRGIRFTLDSGYKIHFYPNRRTARFMKMVWKLFDVRWCTAWGLDANVIAKHYGLDPKRSIKDQGGDGWKAKGADSMLRDWKGPVAWIEDGVDAHAAALMSVRGWKYFHCESFVGVTGEHMKQLREFALKVAV